MSEEDPPKQTRRPGYVARIKARFGCGVKGLWGAAVSSFNNKKQDVDAKGQYIKLEQRDQKHHQQQEHKQQQQLLKPELHHDPIQRQTVEKPQEHHELIQSLAEELPQPRAPLSTEELVQTCTSVEKSSSSQDMSWSDVTPSAPSPWSDVTPSTPSPWSDVTPSIPSPDFNIIIPTTPSTSTTNNSMTISSSNNNNNIITSDNPNNNSDNSSFRNISAVHPWPNTFDPNLNTDCDGCNLVPPVNLYPIVTTEESKLDKATMTASFDESDNITSFLDNRNQHSYRYTKSDSEEDEDVTCNVCDRSFPLPKDLRKHKIKKRHWGCFECGEIFNSEIAMEYHKEEEGHWSDDDEDEDLAYSDEEEQYKSNIFGIYREDPGSRDFELLLYD